MRSILITGGSGKVGFQLVNHFLDNDFLVITTSRNRKKFLTDKVHLINEDRLKFLHVLEVDFTKKDAIPTLLNALKQVKISIEHIIHNARSLDYIKIEDDYSISEENFAGEFHMDVIFPYKLTLEILKVDRALKNIIFISSIYGVVAPSPSLYEDFQSSSPIHYGVSKAAQIHLVKELAVRLGPEIRVNCISFGGIKGRTNKDFEERYKALNPMNNMLKEEDVKGPVEFLISDKAKDMTGQNLIVDGGWTIW
ncbi:SDR family oxidoreductase [Salinimicrobium tongyeongense]|uniref:SDR family oxidoreductase n=1 Tax=Salinimicrobium tongyeongense TaxID=2809707 RepID=A0ABY6NRH1_9FLAO|nr:SDR family oxidoreductase [Salinimicrobium tongyeongense]UZH55515.1 SDR family oxidoreductase [Salinimicrobium tongyeongense]